MMLAQRNQIIEELFVGKNFNNCISKMEPDHLQEDLKMEVISIVCEWPNEKVIELHKKKELEFYVVRVVLNQIKSNTSHFHKKYRKTYTPIENSNLIVVHKCQDEPIDERMIREEAEDLALDEINRLYWYDAEMIRLYLKLGSFRAIEEHTGIPFISCYKNIKKSLVILKKRADEGRPEPPFTKEELEYIQNFKPKQRDARVLSDHI